MMTTEQATEGAKANHRFYGPVTLTKVRNAYQGMVEGVDASGTTRAMLLGDLDAA